MPEYRVNRRAVAHAKRLVDEGRYVVDSDWGEVQPNADDENAFLKHHSWTDYSVWHLGLTKDATDETKARYAFVFGDFKRIHRSGIIACHYRAAEYRHKEVELAAHRLLQYLDKKSGRQVTAQEQFKVWSTMVAESEATHSNDASKGARRMFGSTSLKTGGKMFAFLHKKERLVVKLPGTESVPSLPKGKASVLTPEMAACSANGSCSTRSRPTTG